MKWGLFVLVFSLVRVAGADTLKYPNVDSLSYWNRAIEMRDILITLKKELADTQGLLVTQKVLAEKRKRLFEQSACSEQELREYQWKAVDLEFKIAEIRQGIQESELFEKLFLLRYQWAKEEKAEVLSSIAATYTEQWKERAELANIRVAQAKAELEFRQWEYEVTYKLHAKNAMTEESLIQARDTRDGVRNRLTAAMAHAELAKNAAKESMETQSLVP